MYIAVNGAEFSSGVTPPKIVTPPSEDRVELLYYGTDRSAHTVSSGRVPDLTSDHGHAAIGWPFLQVIASPLFPGLHLAVMKPEEVETFLTVGETNNPGLAHVQP